MFLTGRHGIVKSPLVPSLTLEADPPRHWGLEEAPYQGTGWNMGTMDQHGVLFLPSLRVHHMRVHVW